MTDSMSFGRNIRKPVGKWARRFGLSIYPQAQRPINKRWSRSSGSRPPRREITPTDIIADQLQLTKSLDIDTKGGTIFKRHTIALDRPGGTLSLRPLHVAVIPYDHWIESSDFSGKTGQESMDRRLRAELA